MRPKRWSRGVPVVIRSGSGLGDSIYLQSVVRYFLEHGAIVQARSDYPEVFSQLGGSLRVSPFVKHGVNTIAHYSSRKHVVGTDQFQDCCINAGITEPVEFKLGWVAKPHPVIARLRSIGKPIVCVGLPRTPMARTDGFGDEVLPDCDRIQQIINELSGQVSFIQIGKGEPRYTFFGLDSDMSNRTRVSEVLDIASLCDGFLGYCSFLVPLAESLSRPGLFVWSRRGLNSGNSFVKAITPKKILHRKTSLSVIDDVSDEEISSAALSFYSEIGCRRAA